MTAAAASERTVAAVAGAAREARSAWRWTATAAGLAVALAALGPLVLDTVQLRNLGGWLYLALAAVGLSFALGLAGMPSLCQGAFMAIGAFAAALLRARAGADTAGATIAGVALGTLAGLLLGAGFVRLGRVQFAVATWLVAWLVALGLAAFPGISGGAQALAVPSGLSEAAHYELALTLVALTTLLFFAIRRGLPGLRLAALRSQPAAARALGVPATRLRLGAFVASAAVGSLAGALSVQLAGIADPAQYGPFVSFELFAAVLLGGVGAALGPLAGLGAISGLFHLAHWIGALEHLSTARFEPMIAAILLLAVLAAGGEGIVPWLRSLRQQPAEPPAAAAAGSVALEGAPFAAVEISKRFGGIAALDDVSLEAAPGSIVALIGPNGSGKTTALRIFSGTLEADAGTLALDGRALSGGATAGRVEAGIVRTLQRTSVFGDLTAVENVIVGAGIGRPHLSAWRVALATPKAREESRHVRAAALAALELAGLTAVAGELASTLSSAEQRLLMIAAALATRPKLLLLDEPAAGAAAEDVPRLVTLLARLRDEGLTIVLVEHNLRLVREVASRVVVLDHGRTIAAGTPGEVARSPEVRAAYLGKHRL